MILLVIFLVVLVLALATLLHIQRKRFLVEKDEFLSMASHEIRTPLTGIRWSLENIIGGGTSGLDPETNKSLHIIHENCILLITRVNNMLNMAAIEHGVVLNKEPLLVVPFLREVIKSLASSASQREVAIILDPTLTDTLTINVDAQYIRHVFFNVIASAVKRANASTEVRVVYEQTKTRHLFKVIDRGVGLADDEQKSIFQGYNRTDHSRRSSQEGSGVGLALALKIVDLHGGDITITSHYGEGSTFTISLPV
jgi:signal transduction histidine kinase